MDERNYKILISILKMPLVFVLYVIYMFLSLFIPSKYVVRVINIEMIETELNVLFNSSILLKILALIITTITFIYIK